MSSNIQTIYNEGKEITKRYRNNVVCVREASKITLNSCGWYTASNFKGYESRTSKH